MDWLYVISFILCLVHLSSIIKDDSRNIHTIVYLMLVSFIPIVNSIWAILFGLYTISQLKKL